MKKYKKPNPNYMLVNACEVGDIVEFSVYNWLDAAEANYQYQHYGLRSDDDINSQPVSVQKATKKAKVLGIVLEPLTCETIRDFGKTIILPIYKGHIDTDATCLWDTFFIRGLSKKYAVHLDKHLLVDNATEVRWCGIVPYTERNALIDWYAFVKQQYPFDEYYV